MCMFVCMCVCLCVCRENWGLITFRETALLVDEATASATNVQRVAVVVAHELAHQWYVCACVCVSVCVSVCLLLGILLYAFLCEYGEQFRCL